ncbi:3-mercaptopyruvate sulfurtransferase [Altererythrobacter indicus]|uniref:Sulfurtransferase n=1 Tax=Altericroceibacterium indicum TaxID=374177 RepID=A0A845AA16_9SPHN|nr:3-mercaptopyruvate sulfurtransferase [Altericroceibacterium indicum]MXP25645.1 3-mercaptopyruvate sulfurtransferase [Altericroceibacterium indicum]
MESLVSTEWLANHLNHPDCIILDASSHLPTAERDAAAEFANAHIPGARFLDLASLTDKDSPVPHALANADQVAQRLSALGVGQDSTVILYDDSIVKTSARAWFNLRMHGMKKCAILDGGLGKWRSEGRALEDGEAPVMAADFTPQPGDGSIRSKGDILRNCASGSEQLLDARDAGRFSGEIPDFRPGVASGHIPGSRNLPFTEVYNDNGTFKSPTELRRVFEQAGIDLAKPLITTCGSGVTASVLLFAAHLMGKGNVALYDGSWSEWAVDPETPKATGAAA